jgi:hypothetical protein
VVVGLVDMTSVGGRLCRHAATRPARIVRSFLLIVAIGLAGCGSASPPAPGPIVLSDSDGEALMVMNPDGTEVRWLGLDGFAPSATFGGEGGCDLTSCSQIWVVEIDGLAERLTASASRSPRRL